MAQPAATAAEVTVAGYWVDQSTQQAASTSARASELAVAAWAGFDAWYDDAAIASRAAQAAQVSLDAQAALAQLYAEYVAQMVALLRGGRSIPTPTIKLEPVRGDVNPVVVHARTAATYRERFAFTGDTPLAIAAAMTRERDLLETDMALGIRQGQQQAMQQLGMTHYRRVLRPELSKTGSCGLCIAAADVVYKTKTLMPIHPPTCKCITMPIEGEKDPAFVVNEADLAKVKATASGDESGKDWGNRGRLSNVRVQVREHGEYGPVLTVKGHKFTGPRQIAANVAASNPGGLTPQVAQRQLEQVLPILEDLNRRMAAGADVAKPLEYQRRLVAKLRKIADSQ